jgi:hypothetical protein
MLQKETVDKAVFNLICALQEKNYLKDFILVGGTGLALIIGHRKSVDIDLFSSVDFDAEYILEKLESDFDFQMDFFGGNTIKGNSAGIKVDLLAHKYPWIGQTIEAENIRIASLDDISAMKVNSVANDGTRVKDFIDLYFLLTEYEYNVENLLKNYKAKYSKRNTLHALKSLNYFDDVDLNDWPELIKKKDTSWSEIRETMNKACEIYIGKITDGHLEH